ncbi:hypothetical protein ACKKBF_B31850 [Auxenochlorella protothecoides x Auxenochlorella symbiontica]
MPHLGALDVRHKAAALLAIGSGGALGALGPVFGKLAGRPELNVILVALCYVGLVLCNILGLALFHRTLAHTSSLFATAASTAANMVFSGILGRAVFGEPLRAWWWAGASIMLLGVTVLQAAATQRTKLTSKED